MAFEDYFSFDAILGDLIRWRIRGRDVDGTLPARKAWCRDGVHERKGAAPAMVRQRAIWRTVNRLRKNGGLSGCRWGLALLNLVENVRSRIASTDLMFEKPRMIDIAKGYKSGKPEYRRVASFDNLSDRIILSRMTAYVRDRLEETLSLHCYSFRRDSSITHQTAVEHLQLYRARFAEASLFVGECDIKKFFLSRICMCIPQTTRCDRSAHPAQWKYRKALPLWRICRAVDFRRVVRFQPFWQTWYSRLQMKLWQRWTMVAYSILVSAMMWCLCIPTSWVAVGRWRRMRTLC